MLGFTSSNVALSIIFSNLLQFLWAAINTLQIIVLTALFSVIMPVNAYDILIEIMKLVNFDLIDVKLALEKVISLTELKAFSYLFEAAGYETTNFFIELGILFFFIILFPIIVLLRKLLARLVKNMSNNCITSRLKRQVNNRAIILRFFLEGCVELGLVTMICVRSVSKKSTLLKTFADFHFY